MRCFAFPPQDDCKVFPKLPIVRQAHHDLVGKDFAIVLPSSLIGQDDCKVTSPIFLLILSLSKDAHTSHPWFDRLTMSG